MGWLVVWIVFFAVLICYVFMAWRAQRRDRWQGTAHHQMPIAFLSGGMAIRPNVLGHRVPDAYRYASAFFGVGLIDRAGVLETGFPSHIDDPIPTDFADVPAIDQLCAARAAALVAEARRIGKPLRLLWSGGIDSTCVAVSVLNVLGDDHGIFEVAYTKKSVAEYRKFNRLLKKRGVRRTLVRNVTEALTDDVLIVTGEHGDQIFGSMLAGDIEFDKLGLSWRVFMPSHIAEKIGKDGAAKVMAVLEPQVAACPIRCETVYEMLWWSNFSMKWNTVSHRIIATLSPEKRAAVSPFMRHFFRTDDFQRWSLANTDKKIRESWQSYKYPLKDIIFAFNGDKRYRDRKEKERSLRGFVSRWARRPLAMDANGTVYSQPSDTSLLPKDKRSSVVFSFGE